MRSDSSNPHIVFCAVALTASLVGARTTSATPSSPWRCDFGSGPAAQGYEGVDATVRFDAERVVGFDLGTLPTCVHHGGADALRADSCLADVPFFFSVAVPEGNYRVSLTLGDARASSATTVKAESRRLMLEEVATVAGEFTRHLLPDLAPFDPGPPDPIAAWRLRPSPPLPASPGESLERDEPPTPVPSTTSATRPPAQIERGLRRLSKDEIPPNLSFYTLDPFYETGRSLGWAKERIEERLDRGMLALARENGGVYLGWRLLRDDPAAVAFNVYRAPTSGGLGTLLNTKPLTATTDFVDATAPLDRDNEWWVVPIVRGREQEPSERVGLPSRSPARGYRSIKLKDDVAGAAIVALGDLDGDGSYDFVVKHPAAGGKDPGRVRVNVGTYKIDAYNGRSGAFMWRIDLGWNVDMGIWWTPMVVRDLDGDGRAEVCLRTAPYAATLDQAFPGARKGNVLEGPEWLAVHDGASGALVDRVDWIERGVPEDWADHSGNRASRHMLAVAYLDGKTPAVLVVRGTYGLMKVDAWTLRQRKLERLWRWSNERAPFKFQGQGQHSVKVGDIDGDGCDEILNGAIAIDNDGRTLWSTGNGHGDRFYLTDVDPAHPGLEVFYIHEDPLPRDGLALVDARTGRILWGLDTPTIDNQLGEALVGDIDPAHPGLECWASSGEELFFTAAGERIAGPAPPLGFLAYWDADLLREIVQPGRRASGGARIVKWQGPTLASGIQGPLLQIADILGDWREEIVTFADGELRIHSTTIPARDRRPCLMQDPVYRHDVTQRSMGYPHTPQLSVSPGDARR